MKNNALLKSSIREIKQSPARFFSILGIIFLGVAFFVGIGATGPDMIKSAGNYYEAQRLADVSVLSTLGFSEEDQEYLEERSEIDTIVLQYMTDIHIASKNEIFRFYSFDKDKLNQPKLEVGRLPETADEVALDSRSQFLYELGETIEITDSDDTEESLASHTLEIVGFVTSPEFIDNSKRGNTNVGNGAVDYFALLVDEAFQTNAYARMLLTFSNLKEVAAYSDEYEEKIDKNIEQLEEWLEPRQQERLIEIQELANKELEENRQKIQDGEKQLEDAEKELQEAKEKLDEGRAELRSGKAEFREKITAAKAEIRGKEAQLRQGSSELREQERTLNENQREVDRQAGALESYEEQLGQLMDQRDQLEDTLWQLQNAQDSYQELVSLLEEVDQLPVEEISTILEDIRGELRYLISQLPESNEWAGQIDQLLDLVTPETLATLRQQINALGGMIQSQITTLEQSLAQIDSGMAEITAGQEQLYAAQRQLDAGRQQIEAAKEQIDSGKDQLAEGKAQLAVEEERGKNQLEAAEKELEAGEKSYEEGLEKFNEQKEKELPKLKEAQETLEEEQDRVDDLEPAEFTLLDRISNPGYAEYQSNADRISSIATVFPTIFFFIAALVSLTTMGRMIEEKRVEIGTLKALGYKNSEIAQKFLIYSLSAGLSGAVLGLAVGFYLFPTIIISAYGQLYNIKEFATPWYLGYSSIAVVIALACTVGIAMVSLRVDLFSAPAVLLRPKAPKAGKRIWLEYLRPLWKRLSFIQKVTMRNLFRYKARMLMTIFGIAGCTAMILTGFGLRDSISDIVPIQFTKIWHYQGIVTFSERPEQDEYETYLNEVTDLPDYQEHLAISSETLVMDQSGKASQDVTVYVPEDTEKLSEFVLFNDRQTKEVYQLTDDGAIINEKLAKLFELSVGDSLVLKNADNESFEVTVSAVVENYAGHFAYLSPEYFEEVFHETPEYNTDLLLFEGEQSKETEQEIAEKLMEHEEVINVSYLSDSSTSLDDTTATLNIVVWVLIISAGLLAFIVLYNLNNINISERIRELSTIKVLGFYDNEVTMYIYRENIFLTFFGVLTGLLMGRVLHSYVLQTVELDMIMFSPAVHTVSYLYASLITVFFTIVVGLVMYFKLKKVDMIEALKSNE
ncbi:FtsX-like permease family protein [Enterococcus olivae]